MKPQFSTKVTADEVRAAFNYEPESGLFTRKITMCSKHPAGPPAPTFTPEQIAAVERVTKYINERAKMIGLDPDEIHRMHVGTDRECELRLADLRALVAAIMKGK